MEVLRVFALGSENEDGDDPTADKKQGCVQESNQRTVEFYISEEAVAVYRKMMCMLHSKGRIADG